jgi:hypothetical protein
MLTRSVESRPVREGEVQALARNLKTQIELFSDCIDLSLKQRKALITNDLEANRQVNKQQEKLGLALEKAEKDRMEISNQIFYGKDNHNSSQEEFWKGRPVIKCEMLYSRMTLEHKDLIEALRIELRKKIQKVRELNHTNTALIQNSRNIVQATINIISSLAGGGDSRKRITYGAEGKLNSKHKGKVNLYNRKA